jgi:hypothetical protein
VDNTIPEVETPKDDMTDILFRGHNNISIACDDMNVVEAEHCTESYFGVQHSPL